MSLGENPNLVQEFEESFQVKVTFVPEFKESFQVKVTLVQEFKNHFR